MTAALVAFLFTALRLGTPISLAAMGGYCSERSGTVNIALEGMMLLGAFTAAAIALATHNPWFGLVGGVAGAMAAAALHGFLCIELGSDQIVSGSAVNLLAAGIPPVVTKAIWDLSSGTPALAATDRLAPLPGGASPLMTASLAIAALLWLIHARTRLGSHIRFAGEHPRAAESQGVSVRRVRWIGVLASGLLCGLAGAYLSIEHGGGFTRGMSAGRGFIALAALILGRWTPLGAFAAALAFGFVEASQMLLQGVALPGGQTVPVQWIQALPYAFTLVVLAGFLGGKGKDGRVRAPAALGIALGR